MKPPKTKNKPKITYHTSWICPKCKEIYDADGWAELNVKQAQTQTKLECLKIIKSWLQENFQSTFDNRVVYLGSNYVSDIKDLEKRITKIQQEIKEIEKCGN